MNIAIISPWAISETSVGGTERFTIDLAAQLQKIGNRVEVFMLSGSSSYIQGVKFTSLNILGDEKIADEYDLQAFAANCQDESFYLRWARYLESAIDISTFDVVQLNSLIFIDAWTYKKRLFTIHTNPFEYRLNWGSQRLDCLINKIRISVPDLTKFIAPSEHYAQVFSKLLLQGVTCIPHAFDTKRLDDAERLRAAAQKDTSSKDVVTILLPSRLELVQKRPQIVFRGIALLPEHERRRIRVIASGKDSQYQDNCEKLNKIAEAGHFKAEFFRFNSMNEAYAQADIVALPSNSESFGYSALESLTLGVPTILNDLPTFREIGYGNDNAYFFKKSAPSFCKSLHGLLQDLRTYPVNTAWSKRYDVTEWAKKYVTIFRSI